LTVYSMVIPVLLVKAGTSIICVLITGSANICI
jgi:hypothetical protein